MYVIERLGKYSRTLAAGFHILIPFIDRVAYRHSLKEQAIDVPPQMCITKDNIAVEIDGILYLRVIDPVKASYGIMNYVFAITQLAQTTMRSEIGKIDLDVTFESRENICFRPGQRDRDRRQALRLRQGPGEIGKRSQKG